MKENVFAILIGAFSGLVVYSLIAWLFTRKTPVAVKYIVRFFLFLILLIVIIILGASEFGKFR